jgi:2-dehydropantoate 2-reductase
MYGTLGEQDSAHKERSMQRIVVFGLGGIGGYIGARIGMGIESMQGTGKPELTFIARGAHLEAIKSGGLRYKAPDGTETVVRPTLATNDPSDAGQADFVFLCVKGYDLDNACRAITPIVGPATVVVPLLNGADIYERVRSVVKGGIVVPASIYIASSVTGPGKVHFNSGKGSLVLGREPGRPEYDPAPLRSLLDRSGIPYDWFEDPFPAIWTKYLFIASFALVTARSGLGIGGVIADEAWASVVRGIQAEIAAIAKAKGIALPPDAASQAFDKGKAFAPDTKTSYQRDVETAGKANEGELFGGTILRLGKELGIPTPVTGKIYAEVNGQKV